MKNTIILVGILLTNYLGFAQTDQLNQEKYWKLRDDLREDFVKISPLAGGSLVARGLKPNECWNNSDATPNNTFNMGEMHFGDGMIRQGYYLGLLATEYKLLKDAGEDTRGVLNELYYALEAINRVDENAEFEQSIIYGFSQQKILNGFYQREDIPQNFAKDNWGSVGMQLNCVNSAHFKSNNAKQLIAVEDTEHHFPELFADENSYQNTPSMDQLSSLMVGFRLVHKLVDNQLVKPTDSDEGKYIITELQAIVNRIMTYLNEHNWMMIDVNGWPVNNGGGDCIWAAYPLYVAAYEITGNSYDTDWNRRLEWFHLNEAQYCITGYGLSDDSEEGRVEACDNVAQNLKPGVHIAFLQLASGGTPGPDNNQNLSVYQSWLAGGDIHEHILTSLLFWNVPDGKIPYNENNLVEDDYASIPGPIVLGIEEEAIRKGPDANFGVLATNLGVAAGLWSGGTINQITQLTKNYQLDLVNAVIRGEQPFLSKEFYNGYLDQMPRSGPYNFHNGAIIEGQTVNMALGAPNGWASEHRWTWVSDADGGYNSTGVFNGMDYMLFHNLYRIVFPENQPKFTPETGEECYCDPTITYPLAPVYQNDPGYVDLKSAVDDKLAFVHTCTENVFAKVNNQVSGNFTIAPYFPQYSDIGVFTNKFETENASVEATGHVDIQTPFILCSNSTLNIKQNGVVKLDKTHVSVNDGSTLDISGEFYVQGGTNLIVKSGGNLIIRPGGKLILHENCSVVIEAGASLTYYKDAKIFTKNETGILEIKGSLNLMDNAVFNIDHSLSTISGDLRFTGTPTINAKPGSKIYLDSKGKNDPIIVLSANTVVKFADPDLIEVRLVNCGVDLASLNSQILFEQPVYGTNMRFHGAATYAGKIVVTDKNKFTTSEFVDMYVGALLDVENTDRLHIEECSFTQTNPSATLATGIYVSGMGYIINSTTFAINEGGNAIIESQQMTSTSLLSNCTFSCPNSTIGSPSVYDVSNTQVKVSGCTFNHMRNVVNKSLGTLVLRCNKFNNSYENSVSVGKTCHLDMTISGGGGYNKFEAMTGSADRCHIRLQDATIDMKSGSNYLKDVPIAGGLIKGKLLTSCALTSSCSLDFSGNQWNTIPVLVPPSSRFAIKSSNNIVVQANTLVALPQANCGSLDNSGPILGSISSLTATQLGQIPTYFSQIAGQNMQLINGIQLALNQMTMLHDGIGNDIQAVERFGEIFSSSIDYSTASTITKELLNLAKNNMKVALESAYDNTYSNANDFETHVGMYLNAMNKLTTTAITTSNYKPQFKLEMEKAHNLRMIGQLDKSMDVLLHLESCGLDQSEQEIVNLEKSFYDRDLLINHIGDLVISQPAIINPSALVTPVAYAGPYKFGAIIQSFNNFIYPGCNDFKSLITENDLSTFNVFPNPVKTELNVSFSNEYDEESLIEIMQIDGRLAYQSKIKVSMSVPTTINVEKWDSGAYKIRVIHPDGTQQTATFVIN